MRRTLYGTSQHIIIPWVLFGIADDKYYKSSTNNRSWCTIHHITFPFVLASPVLILLLKWNANNSLAGQYPCWRAQLYCCGARSPWIKILSNQLPCPCHFFIHLAFWPTTGSALFYCWIVTVTPFAQYIFWRRIQDVWDPPVCRSRLPLVSAWNVEKWDVRASINSDMLVPSRHDRVAIMLRLLLTLLLRGIKPGDTLSDARESAIRSSLHISAFGESGSDLMICSRILTVNLIWKRPVSHRNICGI